MCVKDIALKLYQMLWQKQKLDRRDEEMDALRYQAEKLERKYAKYTGYEYEQKMKSALYRKGFALEQIEKYLSQRSLRR